jgi:hypothetical protein
MEYVIGALRGLAKVYGDGQQGLIAYAIFSANTAHLDVRTEDGRIAGPDGVLPDDIRRPISIFQLAKSLQMPFETVRKQVNRLIDAGLCVRVKGGVIVPKAVMGSADAARAVETNVGDVRRLVRDLLDAGLDVPRSRHGYVRPKSRPDRARTSAHSRR